MFLSSKQMIISKYSKFRPLKENKKFQGVGGVTGICGGMCGQVVVSLDKEPYSTLFLFTQVYKWVPATLLGGNPAMD